MKKFKSLRITGPNDKVVDIELEDILNQIENGQTFHWKLLYAWIIGKDNNTSVVYLENEINQSKEGYEISWLELKELAGKIFQTIDLKLIGDKDPSTLIRYKNKKDMYERCEIVIEMIDSSFWLITSRNYLHLEKFEKNMIGSSYV